MNIDSNRPTININFINDLEIDITLIFYEEETLSHTWRK